MSAWPAGPRDETRYAALEDGARAMHAFLVDFYGFVLARRPEHAEALAGAANALTALGYYVDGLELDLRLAELRPRDPVVRYNLACSLALTGRADDALAALARAVADGYRDAARMADDDDLASLRADPRFAELARRAAEGA